jgi:Flp pilus assembly protein TadG/uncharacterized protein YegL
MTTKTENRTLLSRFRKDRRGNFAIMGAVAVPLILAAAGFAMDLTNMVLARAELQDAADSAAIAAASALASDGKSVDEAKAIAATFMKTQLSGSRVFTWGKDGIPLPTVDITEETTAGVGKVFKVAVSTSGDMEFTPLTKLMGYKSTTLNASSSTESATESKNALSMYLALDQSGSMLANTNELNTTVTGKCEQFNESGISIGRKSPCYIKKIEALQIAATSLFNQLKKADPNTKFVRTATASYNSSLVKSYELAWGTTAAQKQVDALKGGGGTSSTGAMNAAYTKLSADTEKTEHKRVNGQYPTKYIILMTDGNNNNTSDDGATETICKNAKDAKMEVYGVAFMAPARGQKLLKACVSSPENYFAAEEMSELVDAFKAIGDRASAVVARVTR